MFLRTKYSHLPRQRVAVQPVTVPDFSPRKLPSKAKFCSNTHTRSQAQVNTIHANVRTGKSRPRSAYDDLCRKLRTAWEELLPSNASLHAVFVHGSLVAGEEQGFLRPEAGSDAEWVRMNMPEFERRAAAGHEDMKLLVEECKARGLGV